MIFQHYSCTEIKTLGYCFWSLSDPLLQNGDNISNDNNYSNNHSKNTLPSCHKDY